MNQGFALACYGMLLLAVLSTRSVEGSTLLQDRIYTQLEGNNDRNSCVRLLDDDQVIGCSSPMKGATGVIYHIQTPTQLANFANAAASSYIVLLENEMAILSNTWTVLRSYEKVKGAMVYDVSGTSSPWSADDVIPNANYGLEGAATQWNSVGGGFGTGDALGLHSLDFGDRPIFHLSEADASGILTRLSENNQLDAVNPPYPLLSANLNNFMWGAVDAETCLRRGFCDPLRSHNIYGTIKEYTNDQEVIMVAAQMDSVSFFHDQSFGANSDASGMVALLTAAKLLGLDANNGIRNATNKNIMFMLFNGEAFGYIGSSKVSFQMKRRPQSNFPTDDAHLSFDQVPFYMELGQLLNGDDTLHTYSYMSNANVTELNNVLGASAMAQGSVSVTQEAGELPPASLRMILHNFREDAKRDAFGGVFVTDHDNTGFVNDAYHTRFDNADNINTTNPDTIAKLCSISSTIARTLWALSTGEDAASITMPVTDADCDYVEELLTCITLNQTCQLVRDSIITLGTGTTGPMSRYIGVNRATNSVTRTVGFFFNQLAANIAVEKNVSYSSADPCSSNGTPPAYQKIHWPGNGECFRTATYTHVAFSPAFETYTKLKPLGPAIIDGGRDPRWPTWTESTWDPISGRIFFTDAHETQVTTVLVSLAYFIVCLAGVYFCSKFLTYESHLMRLESQNIDDE